jgi:hypothetical protein
MFCQGKFAGVASIGAASVPRRLPVNSRPSTWTVERFARSARRSDSATDPPSEAWDVLALALVKYGTKLRHKFPITHRIWTLP